MQDEVFLSRGALSDAQMGLHEIKEQTPLNVETA